MAGQFRYFLICKPYGMLSQFTSQLEGKITLAGLGGLPKDVYPLGRLDEDSEGLLLLSNDPSVTKQFTDSDVEKEYWVQVEGVPENADLEPLRKGIRIRAKGKEFTTLPAKVKCIPDPGLFERNPPIRFRKTVSDSWISVAIREGKNRQVRKMTAAIGFPTLRLIRVRIGNLEIANMQPGEVIEISADDFRNAFSKTSAKLNRKH